MQKLLSSKRSHFLPLKTGTALSPQAKAVQHPVRNRFFQMIFFLHAISSSPTVAKKARKREKSPRNREISGARSHDVFPGFTIWPRGGIFHCPLKDTLAALRKFFARAAPCFLPCRAPFFRHRRRSRSKPTPSSSGSFGPTRSYR